jgi:hypothetical protein
MAVRAGAGRHGTRATARVLLAGGVLLLVASGGLLWWRHGGAVFQEMVAAGIAWCF